MHGQASTHDSYVPFSRAQGVSVLPRTCLHLTSTFHVPMPVPCLACVPQGGVSAERAEREVLQQEAEATAAAHRQAFDDMVAAARAAPDTAPHDPMRFRAVPPGEESCWCCGCGMGPESGEGLSQGTVLHGCMLLGSAACVLSQLHIGFCGIVSMWV